MQLICWTQAASGAAGRANVGLYRASSCSSFAVNSAVNILVAFSQLQQINAANCSKLFSSLVVIAATAAGLSRFY